MRAALAYVDLGLGVFPVGPDARRPLTLHGYKDAARSPQAVRALWAGLGVTNLACACGEASGVAVVDVDVKSVDGFATLAAQEAQYGPLPHTWRTATPSGGAHIWFAHPKRSLRNRVNFLPGLDLRVDGGSVALPPSRKGKGRYQWLVPPTACPLAPMPDWLVKLVEPQPIQRPPAPVQIKSLDRMSRYVASAIDAEASAVAGTPPHAGRNARLFVASAKLGELVGAGLVSTELVERTLEAAAYDCGLIQEDGPHAVRATIASGLRRGVAQPREVRR